MKRGRLLFLVVLLCLSLVAVPVSAQEKAVPLPKRVGEEMGKAAVPGTWYLGDTPPNVDDSKPPIVFVQGLRGSAESWWGETSYHGPNDMYAKAYDNGYRTAFVELYDSGGEGASMWDNGQLLADLLTQIRQHFGEPVNIVAHSKGGIDSQAALIHYGAWPHVGRVVTLGSPHRGSHLADLAYSWWAGWLAELLGARDEGTEVLQTGYMEYFRSVTDGHENAGKNAYYTAAGTSWGPFPSALWTGGAYLSSYGENDGLVNVWSTSLPYGHHLFTEDFDHDNIRMGSTAFPRIESTLRTVVLGEGEMSPNRRPDMDAPGEQSESVVRGGTLAADQRVEQSVAVEAGRGEAVFQIMTHRSDVKTELLSPDGRIYTPNSPEYFAAEEKEILKGAKIHAYRIPQPEAGEWKVRMISPDDGAYLLAVSFIGEGTLDVQMDQSRAKDKGVPLQIRLKNPRLWDVNSFDVRVRVVGPGAKGGPAGMPVKPLEARLQPDASDAGVFKGKIPSVTRPGIYNVTLDIRGKSRDGGGFERTVIRSFFVEDENNPKRIR